MADLPVQRSRHPNFSRLQRSLFEEGRENSCRYRHGLGPLGATTAGASPREIHMSAGSQQTNGTKLPPAMHARRENVNIAHFAIATRSMCLRNYKITYPTSFPGAQ